jgi:hypothetical protein
LIQVGDDPYIASFSSDGSLSSKTKLDRQFWGSHLTASAGGDSFLLAGTTLPVKNGPPPKMLTTLFSSGGKLLRDLTLPSDPAEIKQPKSKKDRPKHYYADKAMLPLLLGAVETDLSGNRYLSSIFACNGLRSCSSGQLLRTLKIKTPEKEMTAGTIYVRAGKLAVMFLSTDSEGQILKRLIVISGTTTGPK